MSNFRNLRFWHFLKSVSWKIEQENHQNYFYRCYLTTVSFLKVMLLHNLACLCMTLHDFAWPCMTLPLANLSTYLGFLLNLFLWFIEHILGDLVEVGITMFVSSVSSISEANMVSVNGAISLNMLQLNMSVFTKLNTVTARQLDSSHSWLNADPYRWVYCIIFHLGQRRI